MDPFSGAMIGYKVGKFGAELWWGTHQDNINQAQGLVEDFENSGAVNYAYIKKAESLLEQVPSDEKDYIVAMQNYLLAICYYYEQMYHASLRCLNIVSDFKIGTFTACAETLADIQNEATIIRTIVLETINAKSNTDDSLDDCFEHEEEDVDEHESFYQCYSAFINDEYDDIDVFLEQLDILILESPNEYSDLSLLGAVACLDKILKIYEEHWAERDVCDIYDFREDLSEYIISGIEYINNVKCSCSNSKSNEIKIVDYCLNAHFNKAIQRDDENDEIADCSEDISGNLFSDEYIKALYEQTVRYINSFWLKDEEFDEDTEKMDVLKNEDEDKSLTDGEHEYLSEYKEIIAEGKISERDYRFLLKIKHSNGISDERAKELENFAAQSSLSKNEQEYLDEYKDIIQSGTMTERDKRYLNKIKVSNGISDSRAIELEKMIKSK